MSTVTKTVLAAAVAEMSVPEVSGLRISQGSEAKRLVADPQCVEPQPGALMESIVGSNPQKLPRGILREISTYRSLTLLESFRQAQACKGTCRALIKDKSGHIEWTCDRLEALVPVAEEFIKEIRDLEQQLEHVPEDIPTIHKVVIRDIRDVFNEAYKKALKKGAGKEAALKETRLPAEHNAIGQAYFEPLLKRRNALLDIKRTEQWSNFLKADKSSMTVPPDAVEKAWVVYNQGTKKTVKDLNDFLPFQQYCKDKLKPFFVACVNHDTTPIEEQIKLIDMFLPGLDINVRYPDDIKVNGKTVVMAGDTALQAAVRAGLLEKGWFALLEKGMRANACTTSRDGSHFYPLFNAALDGHKEVVKALLDKGADVNRKNGPGQFTALGAVIISSFTAPHLINGRVEVVDILLERGAKVNNVEAKGGNALTIACKAGRVEVVKFLLEATTHKGQKYFTPGDYEQARGAAIKGKQMADLSQKEERIKTFETILNLLSSA